MFAGVQPTFALQLAQDEAAEARSASLPARLSQAGIRTAILGHRPIYRVAATRDFESSDWIPTHGHRGSICCR